MKLERLILVASVVSLDLYIGYLTNSTRTHDKLLFMEIVQYKTCVLHFNSKRDNPREISENG